MNAALIEQKTRQGALSTARALPAFLTDYSGFSYYLVPISLSKLQPGKNGSEFLPDSLQAIGIESQGWQDCRCALCGFDRRGDRLGLEPGVRQEHHHVGVVMVKTAMLH